MARRDQRKRHIGFSKQANLQVLSWAVTDSGPPHLYIRIKFLHRGLKWVQSHTQPKGLNTTLLSQSYILEITANMVIAGETFHIQGRSKKAMVAQDQLQDQSVVKSSQ